MDQNIKLGTIAGIEIGINWSILLIFFLIAWEMADLVLPVYRPHEPTAAYWIVGVATTAIFFATLLAHEVSHSLVAKHHGVNVRRITLWLFGGVSELESEALDAGTDFRIAVVGPLTTLIFAAVFGAIALSLGPRPGLGGLIIAAVGWLAWMNVILGVFNLLPGAPLDGGRVLRAVLWRRSGDRLAAALAADRAGEFLGYLLIVVGAIEFVTVSIFGIWIVFMGWFLLAAARSEQNSVVMRSSLTGVRVSDVMTKNPTVFDPTMTVGEMVDRHLLTHHFGTFPLVGTSGEVEGLTTMSRIRRVPANQRSTTRLGDIAAFRANVPVATPDEPIADLLTRMQASPDGRALVLDAQGQLVGIVSPTDVARYVQWCMMQSQNRSPRAKESR